MSLPDATKTVRRDVRGGLVATLPTRRAELLFLIACLRKGRGALSVTVQLRSLVRNRSAIFIVAGILAAGESYVTQRVCVALNRELRKVVLVPHIDIGGLGLQPCKGIGVLGACGLAALNRHSKLQLIIRVILHRNYHRLVLTGRLLMRLGENKA